MIEKVVNRISRSITYVIPTGTDKECWLVDCGDKIDDILEQGWFVKGVLLTHSHVDHIYGLNRLVEVFPDALVYTNEYGKEGLLNPRVNFSKYHTDLVNFVFTKPDNIKVLRVEGVSAFDVGFEVEVMFTPGHVPDCISYRIGNCVFTGDAYIKGEKTNTGFPRSDKEKASESLERLIALASNGYEMMCGHPERSVTE